MALLLSFPHALIPHFPPPPQHWMKGALAGKPVSFFTSTATQGGGQETTILTSLPFVSVTGGGGDGWRGLGRSSCHQRPFLCMLSQQGGRDSVACVQGPTGCPRHPRSVHAVEVL